MNTETAREETVIQAASQAKTLKETQKILEEAGVVSPSRIAKLLHRGYKPREFYKIDKELWPPIFGRLHDLIGDHNIHAEYLAVKGDDVDFEPFFFGSVERIYDNCIDFRLGECRFRIKTKPRRWIKKDDESFERRTFHPIDLAEVVSIEQRFFLHFKN